MSRNLFTQVGVTSDNNIVVDGVWHVYETYGIPLDILLTCLKVNNSIPDWILLYKQMRISGMDQDRVFSKLDEAVSDSFGKDFSDIVLSNLKTLFVAN